MQYPVRTPQHITETDSWKVFAANTPPLWIIREVTERDYGIDAYIEIPNPKGQLTGNLCSIQLKGTNEIEWSESENGPRATLSVPISTVNYWMGLPVPVFLVLADLKTRRLHFAPVKFQVRNQYAAFRSQKTFGFRFRSEIALGTEAGDLIFLWREFQESSHEQFRRTVREFLIHWEQYLDFIQGHAGCDEHLGIEVDDELMFCHIYSTSIFLAQYLNLEWTLPTLAQVYEKEKHWKDEFYRLHQHTLNPLLESLEAVFLRILDRCREHVVSSQCEFWRITDCILYQRCQVLDLKPRFEDCERRQR